MLFSAISPTITLSSPVLDVCLMANEGWPMMATSTVGNLEFMEVAKNVVRL